LNSLFLGCFENTRESEGGTKKFKILRIFREID